MSAAHQAVLEGVELGLHDDLPKRKALEELVEANGRDEGQPSSLILQTEIETNQDAVREDGALNQQSVALVLGESLGLVLRRHICLLFCSLGCLTLLRGRQDGALIQGRAGSGCWCVSAVLRVRVRVCACVPPILRLANSSKAIWESKRIVRSQAKKGNWTVRSKPERYARHSPRRCQPSQTPSAIACERHARQACVSRARQCEKKSSEERVGSERAL